MARTRLARSLPMPPADVREESDGGVFVPAGGLDEWVRSVLLDETHRLYNRDHAHLRDASIGWLWTNVPYAKQGRTIIGTAEMPKCAGAWGKARFGQQVREWFDGMDLDVYSADGIPDFLITLYAPWFAEADEASRCALVEHEMYHCGIRRGEEGEGLYNEHTGRPLLTMRGHDVEEFVGVVRRYGADAAGVRELVDVAQRGPTIARADISAACGCCK